MIRLFRRLLYLILPLTLFFSFNKLNAQTWSSVGDGAYGGYVYSLCPFDSVLYAGGTFIGPGNHIAQWDGNTWKALGSGINGDVYAMSVYKDSLYAGGYFSNAGGYSAANIAGWSGKQWFPLQQGMKNSVYAIDTFHNSLCVENNYLGGIGLWTGKKWSPGIGAPFSLYSVNAMTVFKGNLYVAASGNLKRGSVFMSGTVVGYLYEYIASTKKWKQIAVFPDNYNITNAECLAIYNNNLYIGGTFDSANHKPANNIAVCDGDSIIDAVGIGTSGPVNALTVYRGALYIGGLFDSAGGKPANNIACWNDTNWSALGSGVNNEVFALAPFKGDLYVGGGFTSPGSYIAKYNSTIIPDVTYSYNIQITPNPNYGTFMVTSESINANSKIEIYNVMGQNVYEFGLNGHNTEIALNGCAQGVYFYRVLGPANEKIATGKFIVL